MKPKRPTEQLKARQRQRSHAKRRFQERFSLDMNRDRIHDIEEKITTGAVVAADSKHGKTNYLVEVQGRLVLVGYDPATHRVVTVLPEERLGRLPTELISLARALLLPSEQEVVIAQILSGNARRLGESQAICYYELEFEGILLKIGYDRRANRLCRYKRQLARRKKVDRDKAQMEIEAAVPVLPELDIPVEVAADFQQQIHDGRARFLWRYSKSVTFQQVDLSGEKLSVGYSRTRRVFFPYREPPETKPELRSSVRLLTGSRAVIEAVSELVRAGKAELLEMQDDRTGSYRVEHFGEVYYFNYDTRSGRIEPWKRGR